MWIRLDIMLRTHEFVKKDCCADSDALPFVSVIVPTLGGRWLGRCLASLAQYRYPHYEVIVVTDRARKGPGYARNRGLEVARGGLVHFVDDDGLASEDNLVELVRALFRTQKEDASIGGVSGAIVDPSGRKGTVCRVSFSRFGLRVTSETSEGTTECVFTGNALFPKRVLEEVDGFDEQISHQFEDVDLSLRIRESGHRLYATSSATVYHVGRDADAFVLDRQFRHFYASRNYVLLLSKWMSFHYALVVGYGLTLVNAVLILPSIFIMAGAKATRSKKASSLGIGLPHTHFEKALGTLCGLAVLGRRNWSRQLRSGNKSRPETAAGSTSHEVGYRCRRWTYRARQHGHS